MYTKEKKELKKELRKLQKSFCKINSLISDSDFYDSIDKKFSKEYPFDKSFDEVTPQVNNWIENMYPSLKIVKGTAIYTGGGFYSIVGKLNDGNYINATCEFWDVYNDNAFDKLDEEKYEYICDDIRNYEHPEWCDEHRVSEQYQPQDVFRAIKKFCKDLDNGKGDKYLIDEFKDTGNYAPGELKRMVYNSLKESY